MCRWINLEHSCLGHCRPNGADFGISTNHRDQVSACLASLILRRFENGSVNMNANAGGGVLHAFRELEHSKALVCVLHFGSFW
jgi:hypothetical protein